MDQEKPTPSIVVEDPATGQPLIVGGNYPLVGPDGVTVVGHYNAYEFLGTAVPSPEVADRPFVVHTNANNWDPFLAGTDGVRPGLKAAGRLLAEGTDLLMESLGVQASFYEAVGLGSTVAALRVAEATFTALLERTFRRLGLVYPPPRTQPVPSLQSLGLDFAEESRLLREERAFEAGQQAKAEAELQNPKVLHTPG